MAPSDLAWAKGPVGVGVDGPGLDEPLVVDVNSAAADVMWALQELVGPLAGPETLPAPARGDLGPAYQLTWFMSEARDRDRVRQDVYPYADGGPMVQTLPGQTEWHQLVLVGWSRAGADLAEVLTRLGVPLSEPTSADAEVPAMTPVDRDPVEPATDPPWLVVSAAIAALIAVVGVAALVARKDGTLRV
jgi:hypothetical protein